MGWLLADPRVECLAQFGVRQLLPEKMEDNGKVVAWPGTSALAVTPAELFRSLPWDLPYYVTIDVDCLDPLVMPSTGTPVAGGFTHLQLVSLLDELCGGPLRVIGVDLVEYLPDGYLHAGHIAADLILHVMDGALSSAQDSEPRAARRVPLEILGC
jgi:agmatinase